MRSKPGVVRSVDPLFLAAALSLPIPPPALGQAPLIAPSRLPAAGRATALLTVAQPGRTVNLAVGDVIEERVRIVNAAERHLVAVVVPLAAGMEPLNPNLATAPPEAKPTGSITLAPTCAAYLDDQAAFCYDTLPKGACEFAFRTKATVPGSFVQPPAKAELMCDGAVRGNGAGARIEVTR